MTEAEWLAATDPTPMLDHVRQMIRVGSGEGRKNYLLAVAAGCSAWELIRDERMQRAVRWAEAFADDLDDPTGWQGIVAGVHHAYQEVYARTGGGASQQFAGEFSLALGVSRLLQKVPLAAAADILAVNMDRAGLNAAGAALVRDIFGNPFRPVAVDPSWRTSTVVALAEGIYQERAFDRMPILADALQDTGCANEDVLNHCRGPGPHVRGCWVIDLLLGKE